MKRQLIAIFFVAVMLIFCVSCNTTENGGDTSADTTAGVTFEVDLSTMRQNMIDKFEATDSISVETESLLDLYGIKGEDVEESACYMTMDGVFPQEIIMIKATSKEAADRVAASLENRLSEIKAQSQNYDPENYALAQKCKVENNGEYVTLFVSAHNEEMSKMFWGK